MTHSLALLLAHRASTRSHALAYAHGDEHVTYAQLFDDARSLASGLQQAGVRAGDRVALILPSGLDWVRAFWAVQLAGAVSCAFNPYVPPETAARRASHVRPKLVITSLDDIPRGTHAPIVEVDAEELAFLQPTSGTSGESRAVMIRHRNILSVMESSLGAYAVDERDVLVAWVPPWHDLGLVRFIIGTIFNGASCHIVTPSIQTIPRWFETITRVRATITGAPDFAYRLASRLVDPSAVDLSSLRWMTNGGEPVRASTIEAFESRFGRKHVVCPGYGLAEATLGVTFTRPEEPLRLDARGNVSCGKAMPGVELRIDDGEILVRGNGVFAGYFDAPDATAETLRDGWLHTGDIGHLDDDGELYVLGRRRAMLKRGGAVLAPRELEEAAQKVEGVRLAAAVGLSHETTEEIVVAIEVDPRLDADLVRAQVAEEVRRTLGFAPERVLAMPPRSIPRTYNGKIRHDALRGELERRRPGG